jgi:hypothetical protein
MKTTMLLTGLLAALMSGCGAIDSAADCQSICDRYRTCFDSAYDVTACASRCRADSNSNADHKRQADSCNACIDSRSCTSATFNCGASCGSIVP